MGGSSEGGLLPRLFAGVGNDMMAALILGMLLGFGVLDVVRHQITGWRVRYGEVESYPRWGSWLICALLCVPLPRAVG